MILIQLTREQVEKYSNLPHFMTRTEIKNCMDIDKLRNRHRMLFHRLLDRKGDRYDLVELMRIVQRMAELGKPFNY